jgi:hypothetical protein
MGGARGPAALARSRQVIAPVTADAVEDPVESVDFEDHGPPRAGHAPASARYWAAMSQENVEVVHATYEQIPGLAAKEAEA